jgi:hypothetical protein
MLTLAAVTFAAEKSMSMIDESRNDLEIQCVLPQGFEMTYRDQEGGKPLF